MRFKSITCYTDYGGYVLKKDSAYTHINVNYLIVIIMDNPLPSVFIHDQQQV